MKLYLIDVSCNVYHTKYTMLITFLISIIIVTIAVGLWSLIILFRKPSGISYGSKGSITGTCGDTMEIVLTFHNGRVYDGTYWTDGCPHSFMCLYSAVQLARGKRPEYILDLNYKAVVKSVGGLPEDHMHCATLAIQTLHSAVDEYMSK
jgi:nitrogen fixation NifU-like protein